MTRKHYIAPSIEVRKIENESIMAALSMGFSDDPAHGGGMARHQDFFDQEPETNGGRSSYHNDLWAE